MISKLLGHRKNIRQVILGAALIAALIVPGIIATASTNAIDLGLANGLAALSLCSGNGILASGPSNIYGHVGVVSPGQIHLSDSATIHGDLLLGIMSNYTHTGTSGVTGTVFQNGQTENRLSGARTNVLAASASFASLPANHPETNLDGTNTITSVGGQNVLNVENLRLSNSETLTLVGSPGDTFIININRQYSLSGSSQIILSGGLTPQDVVFNFPTAGAQISVTGPAIATGIIVAPSRTYTSSGGVFNGEVVACNIDVNEGAVINNPAPPTSPTPTPTPRTITVVVLPCEAGRNLPRIQFVGDRTSLTFFLNGQQVFPDVNGIVEVQPGQYHWEAFLAIQRIAEGDVTVIDCAIQQTPTPSPSPPMMTPTPTPPTVPEPITIVLFGTGLASLGFAARRRLGRNKVGNSDTESTEN